MTANVMVLVRDFLLSKSGLSNVVGTNIWAKFEPPPGYTPAAAGPGVLFGVRGGGDDYAGCVLFPSIQYQCIGETEEQAWAVYIALADALSEAPDSDHSLLSTRIQAQGQLVRSTKPPWPRVFCAFVHHIKN